MNNNQSNPSEIDYVETEAYRQNLDNQLALYDQLRRLHNENYCHEEYYPFTTWHYFVQEYSYVRAGLSSLLKNPDTKDDPDFLDLCYTWKQQTLGHFELNQIEKLYDKVGQKPVFYNNPIFREISCHFENSIYQLLNSRNYTEHFFELDE